VTKRDVQGIFGARHDGGSQGLSIVRSAIFSGSQRCSWEGAAFSWREEVVHRLCQDLALPRTFWCCDCTLAPHFPRPERRNLCPEPWSHLSTCDLIANSQARKSHTSSFAMWILPLIGYVGLVLGFAFLTLAIGEFPSYIPLPAIWYSGQ